MILTVLLGIIGVTLSAFFGGTETGFYRVSRIRVQLNAIEGDRISRLLLHLINHPSLFIATILLGNSFANYLISAAAVLFVQTVFVTTGNSAEILVTLLLTPFLFVFAEMFPKYIFMQAPERLLRCIMPPFFVFHVLMLPISSVIWLLNRSFAFLLGETHEPLHLRLARRELTKRFDEGQEYGLILPAQRQLTRNVFQVASQSILHYMTPVSHYPVVTLAMPPVEMLVIAKRYELSEFPVFAEGSGTKDEEQGARDEDFLPLTPHPSPLRLQPVGYVRTIELALALTAVNQSRDGNGAVIPPNDFRGFDLSNTIALPLRELIEIDNDHSPLNVMLLFQACDESLGMVTDENDNILGLISEKCLMSILFTGKMPSIGILP